jgi:hypothetical protein
MKIFGRAVVLLFLHVLGLCLHDSDSSDHLFLQCSFALALWNWLNVTFNTNLDLSSLAALVLSCCSFNA